MARKRYAIENLGCANCAAKIEAKMNSLEEVEEAVITFATRQLWLTAADPDSLIPKLTDLARTVEDGVVFRPWNEHREHHEHHEHHGHHGHGCGGGHCHEHEEHHSCDHDHDGHRDCSCSHDHGGHDHHHHHHGSGQDDLKAIVIGAGLFAIGLALQLLGLDWISKGAFVAAYLVLGWQVLGTAVKNMVKGHVFDENFLMSLATLGAFAIGEFPEAVGVMLFYRVGEFFEEKAVERSRSQIMEAVDLRPEVVNRMEHGYIHVIPAKEAKAGDLLLVRPGDRIPVDGVVESGESRIDTAPITGEPVPVSAEPGSSVISGCVNTTGQLVIRVEKPLSESMVTRILESVENAAASKPRIDRFITRFARIYTPVVVILAATVAVVPSLITKDWNYWVYTALSFLVMSCPCALVLSVPLAFFSGIGAGSKKGILFKGGMSIEAMGKVRAVVMDKTGTLTRGDFRVQNVVGREDLLALCASCEQHSNHPIAASITAAAAEQGIALSQPEQLKEIPGRGIRAILNGRTVLCGNGELLEEAGIAVPAAEEEILGSRVLVAVDGEFVGYLLISDTLKPDSAAGVAALQKRGLATVMLTGDAETSANAVARQVGIQEVYAKLLPQQKLEQLHSVRSRHGAAMFVGDGINDAPVLAGADVGAAMGSGADAAIEAADVVFMTTDVGAIAGALDIADRTTKIAWQNVYFALGIKAAVMVLGLCGFASMWMAVFADSGVAMLCVLNSIRLLYQKT